MDNTTFESFLSRWEEVIKSQDLTQLNELLAEDVTFYSPVVHTPQEGKFMTAMYLMGAGQVLKDDFNYKQKIIQGLKGVLEFQCKIDDIIVNGVDIIELNEDGKIINFKVMVRPIKAIHKLHEMMGKMLAEMKDLKV